MDTEEIRTFLEIVRQGSFSKAARELDLAQPTVSTRIQALDKEAGGALLPTEVRRSMRAGTPDVR
jgi:DNA-binding transcriptional LysR family regulator